MKLIVGLGNPGKKFQHSRHNIGFSVADHLAEKYNLTFTRDTTFKADVAKGSIFIIIKPLMFMNSSGIPVSKIASYFKIPTSDIWVIHDDIDLPMGKLRIRKGGASAGHHGVESIIENLRTDLFVRFRLGVGRGKEDIKKPTDRNMHRREIEKFVLEPFGEGEAGASRKMIGKAAEIVEMAIEKGLAVAMNRNN